MIKYFYYQVSFLLFALPLTSLNAQQLLQKTIEHDGVTREYTLYIPSNYDDLSELPLLFNFHGGSGDIASQIAISDMRVLADSDGFLIVYPQALPDPNDGGSTQWTHKPPSTIDDVFFVEAMIDALALEYKVDEDRVYACGYSNGGEFSLELACRLSNRIAAIGTVARSIYIETFEACSPTRPIGIVSIQGTNDDYDGITFGGITYYLSMDDLNNFWSTHNNTDVDPTVVEIPNTSTTDGSTVDKFSWDNGDDCLSILHYKVNGGGHDWPGSFGNMDIDASEEIWNYVSQYDLNGLIDCATVSSTPSTLDDDIKILNNPTDGVFIIHHNNFVTPIGYEICTLYGQRLIRGQLVSNNSSIDISKLSNNLYLLKLANKTYKIIKTH